MGIKEKRIVKKALNNYPKMFGGTVQSIVDWAESNMAVDYSKVAVQTSPNRDKETQLCILLDKNLDNMRWAYVVEKTLEHYKFNKEKIAFIENHFFKQKGDIATCLSIGICRATFYNWQEEILEIAYNWARELKLIKESDYEKI